MGGGDVLKLYLARHCHSIDGPREDQTRGLDDLGRKQAADISAWLARQIGHVDIVLTSPFTRAVETADPLAEALGCEVIVQVPELMPDCTAAHAWIAIRQVAGDDEDVLVVTHHPLIGELLELLTHAKTDEMKHGSIAHLVTGIDVQEGWVTMNGAHIFIGDGEEGKAVIGIADPRVQRAIDAQVRTGVHEQRIADRSEAVLAKAIGVPRTADNSAFDLRNKTTGVEIKTLIHTKNDKITMSKAAMARKNAEIKSAHIKAYTVVADRRGAGGAKYYYRSGVGSFRVGAMTPVSLSDMRGIVRGGK